MGERAGRPIREELLSIPGIAGAEFDGDPSTPTGVRVQLAPGADAVVVGREVRRVLAGHGMRSQMTAPDVAPRRPPLPPEPRTVVNLADFDQGTATDDAGPDVAAPEPEVEPGGAGREGDDAPAAAEAAGGEAPEPAGPEEEPSAAAADGTSVPILGDVVVRQRGGGVLVSVSAGDRTVERLAVATTDGVDQALLGAVCEVLDVSPVPTLVSVGEIEQSGSQIISVLVDDGSTLHAGSAVSRGNRAWAVARALWSAVSGPA